MKEKSPKKEKSAERKYKRSKHDEDSSERPKKARKDKSKERESTSTSLKTLFKISKIQSLEDAKVDSKQELWKAIDYFYSINGLKL